VQVRVDYERSVVVIENGGVLKELPLSLVVKNTAVFFKEMMEQLDL
jgi:uncharacterized protein